jgi:cation diffusion facilitator family transporter
MMSDAFRRARRLAVASVTVSAGLAATNLLVGLTSGSSAVLALGVEFAGDVLASSVVLVGLLVAAKPPDENHPYGHGRIETLAGFTVGLILAAGGSGICYRSLQEIREVHPPPGTAAIAVLFVAIAVRSVMGWLKFRTGRQLRSASLVADAWNDTVDILSATAALIAVWLSRLESGRFAAADHYGGFAVGLIVILTGLRVVREASLELADTMPEPEMALRLKEVALKVDGVRRVEQQRARKTGLQYHADLHIEVDPQLTVLASHAIAAAVRRRVRDELPWVADVLVHVEPDERPGA